MPLHTTDRIVSECTYGRFLSTNSMSPPIIWKSPSLSQTISLLTNLSFSQTVSLEKMIYLKQTNKRSNAGGD